MASSLNYDGGLTISFQSADMKRSIAWYQDVLGFKLLYQVDEIGWCELQTEVAGGKVNVGFSQVEKPKTGAGAVPTFGVKDIAKARAMLEGKKVKFDGPTREYPGHGQARDLLRPGRQRADVVPGPAAALRLGAQSVSSRRLDRLLGRRRRAKPAPRPAEGPGGARVARTRPGPGRRWPLRGHTLCAPSPRRGPRPARGGLLRALACFRHRASVLRRGDVPPRRKAPDRLADHVERHVLELLEPHAALAHVELLAGLRPCSRNHLSFRVGAVDRTSCRATCGSSATPDRRTAAAASDRSGTRPDTRGAARSTRSRRICMPSS